MKKRKIIWFCAAQFSDENIKTTATWLIAMGNALAEIEDIELYNITYGSVDSISQINTKNITQWIIPFKDLKKHHRGSKALVSFVKKIDEVIEPDIIHVWGTENEFGSIINEAKLKTPVLLDIQGLLFAYVKFYYGGLDFKDLIKCIDFKEIIKPRFHPYFIRRSFKKKGKQELRLIRDFKYISVQSDWVNSVIKNVNNNGSIFHTGIMLRKEFYDTSPWKKLENKNQINIFTSSSGPIPYKGIHVVIEAIALLKTKYPNIKLNIGGDFQLKKKYGLFRNGYMGWLLRKINKLGLTDSISWLGMLSSEEIINEMYKSSVVVVPSYIETYCLFMAESMMVGVPTVASFSGAMPQLAEHGKSALYFSPGDHWECASCIEKIIENTEFADMLSLESRKRAFDRNNQGKVLKKQLEIYSKII